MARLVLNSAELWHYYLICLFTTQERFEEAREVPRSCKLKMDRLYNGQIKKDKQYKTLRRKLIIEQSTENLG